MIVITSGKNGKRFVPAIHTEKQILGVIIFCNNPDYHREWSSQYPIVKKICTCFDEVKEEIQRLNGLVIFASATNAITQQQLLNEQGVDDSSRSYFHCCLERALEFKMLILLEDRSNRDPKYELCDLNKPATQAIRADYDKFAQNPLRAICYVYSSDNIFREFNRACANRAYYRVSSSIRIAVRELKKQPEKMFIPKNSTQFLYRGVKRNQIKIEDYKENQCGFFSAFTSTSLSKEVGLAWATDNGVLFVIRLSDKNTYPNVNLYKAGWSAYQDEKEVLIFPFFSFRITKVEREGEIDWVYIEQNEKDSVLTIDMNPEWINSILESMDHNIQKAIDEISSFPLFDIYECSKTTEFRNMFINDETHPSDIFLTLLWENFSQKYETEERYIRIMDAFLKQVFKQVNEFYMMFDEIVEDQRMKSHTNREELFKEFLKIIEEPHYKELHDKRIKEYDEFLQTLKGTWRENIAEFLDKIKKL